MSSSRDDQFARLALPLLPAVARIARALTRDEADAEDLVQETFLRAYRGWHTFDQAGDPKRWLAAICRNTWRRSAARDAIVTAVDDEALDALAVAHVHNAAKRAGVDAMYATLDLGPAITEAIEALDPAFRDVVVLADVEGFAYEEIAELLHVPVGTVRSRLYRARRRLQERLMQHAIDLGLSRPAAPQEA